MDTVRDRLWLWGHEAGAHNGQYNLPSNSRMTPAEAAFYLGVPNALMISYDNKPEPPFDQHMLAFAPLKRVVWSIVGDSASTRTDLDEVLALAAKFPNLSGAVMDDFFHKSDASGAISRVSVADLRSYHERLTGAAHPLALHVVVYAHDLDLPIQPYLEPCDVITYWTWTADQLPDLARNFARLEKIAPAKRKLLGCYLWDYGAGKAMPLERMQQQCRQGLEWLRAGRVDGMIFLANTACDQGLETVAWTRQWIAEVGDTAV
jgi:hypothetical protein